ncbi:hypothetical protein [Clostridium sp.]|uniref:hypothetical protein n=1 Tax=Clostridium sp. TaxID=1506 RepID=UPI0025C150B0|nr:hypothetical protein [Clostridium sp.]
MSRRTKLKLEGKNKNMFFKKLAEIELEDNKNLVISETETGFTIAQKVVYMANDQPKELFLKGAIHINSTEKIIELRDALNEAIELIT